MTTVFKAKDAIQTFTAPETGTYDIHAWGAEGGLNQSAVTGNGGKGAEIGGDFTLIKGETLSIIVGGRGASERAAASVFGSGGGGGSFIYTRPSPGPVAAYQLFLAAGGGGGAPRSLGLNGGAGLDGLASNTGGDGVRKSGLPGDGGANSLGGGGGSAPEGDANSGAGGGGGGGFQGSGGAFIPLAGGQSVILGGKGGGPFDFPAGGFGGGGSGGIGGGGGGGGYSGGGGGSGSDRVRLNGGGGGGGGSYNGSTMQNSDLINLSGDQASADPGGKDGYVSITQLTTTALPSPITPSPLIPIGTPISLEFIAAALLFLPTLLGNLTPTSTATGGGTISITPGMLGFSLSPRLINGGPTPVQETGSEGCLSQFAFDGTSGGIGAGDFSSDVLGVFNGTAPKVLGQLALNDNAGTHAYSAAEFSLQGNPVFHHAISG